MTRFDYFMLVVIIALLASALEASRGECFFCPNFTCYTRNACGQHCVCLRHGSDVGGECVSAE